MEEHDAPVKWLRSYAVCVVLDLLLRLGAVSFDFECLWDEPTDPGPLRCSWNTLRWEDADEDEADERGLGWSTGVTTNPISCATLQSGPCFSLRHIRTATVRKMPHTMIDATMTPTIFPLRFEWLNRVSPGVVGFAVNSKKQFKQFSLPFKESWLMACLRNTTAERRRRKRLGVTNRNRAVCCVFFVIFT